MARRPNKSQQAAIDAFLKAWEPQIAKAFADSVYRARAAVDFAALVDAIDRGDIPAALAILRLDPSAFAPLRESVRAAYIAGGQSVAETIMPKAIAATWAFNGYSPRVVNYIDAHGAALIQGIIESSQDAVNSAVTAAINGGGGLRSAARSITGTLNRATGRREGGIIGLTAEQTDWVINARNDLTTLDARYFTRVKRDARYDAIVRKAIKDGTPLSAMDIEKITGRYKDRLLAMRGNVIARNEAFTAQASSNFEAMRQTLDRDDVQGVTKRWQHNLSQNPRADHVAINGTVIGLDERFQLDGAAMLYPHDPAGGADHSIGCRCVAIYRVIVE